MTRQLTAREERTLATGGMIVSLVDGCIQKRVRRGPFDVITTEPPVIRGQSADLIVIDDFCEGNE